ncbi:hypothetical protein DAPPUDRAFT_331850 [Daphnia pulex]|uniref:HTH CENPB-type domain-containing protein n=1 Tax=Daphnia pulex TaxID=6669 RepID=E9HNM1_DAPPU|nr:hypothetical protein DAPPUDRAFT_331850 [Daphnia pulex]|eukprot:EFX66660.1 hypothetical protein DAPPUDRAFT_331850 [Daphnia pulex]
MPSRWEVNEEAGKDWFSSFLRRNSRLSIRKPERTSQARAAAVNHVVIDQYFDDLYNLYEKNKFKAEEKSLTLTKQITQQWWTLKILLPTKELKLKFPGKAFPGTLIFPRVKVNLK